MAMVRTPVQNGRVCEIKNKKKKIRANKQLEVKYATPKSFYSQHLLLANCILLNT